MSIYFSRRAGHGTNHAMFEASALHRALVPSCATYRSMESARSGHGSMLQPCASLAYSASTGSWKITHQRTSAARAGRAGRSSLGPTRAPIRGAHRHGAQRTIRPHHAGELSTMSLTAELEQHWPASGGRQQLSHTPRVGWQGQQRSGGGLRMEGGSMGGLPRVDASSRPCAPLDLPRSPARRAGSGRFTIGVERVSLPFLSALRA